MDYAGPQFKDIDELASRLNIPANQLIGISRNLKSYIHPIHATKKDGTPRKIMAPNKILMSLLSEVKSIILEEYKYPDYSYGLGKKSLRDHALVHDPNNALIKFDIRDFFPSITHKAVFEMWKKDFKFPHDVASILTRLTTYKGSLQQGFPTSSHIAAIVSSEFSDQVDSYCRTNKIAFSQYVDDFNLSSPNLNIKTTFQQLMLLANSNRIPLKKRKTQFYPAKTNKIVTGVSVGNNMVRAPRYIRKRAYAALKTYSSNPEDKITEARFHGYVRYLSGLRKRDGKALVSKYSSRRRVE